MYSGSLGPIERNQEYNLGAENTETTPLLKQSSKITTATQTTFKGISQGVAICCNSHPVISGCCGGTGMGIGIGALASSPLWATGTGLWVSAGSSTGMLLAGEILVGMGSGVFGVISLFGCGIGICAGNGAFDWA